MGKFLGRPWALLGSSGEQLSRALSSQRTTLKHRTTRLPTGYAPEHAPQVFAPTPTLKPKLSSRHGLKSSAIPIVGRCLKRKPQFRSTRKTCKRTLQNPATRWTQNHRAHPFSGACFDGTEQHFSLRSCPKSSTQIRLGIALRRPQDGPR